MLAEIFLPEHSMKKILWSAVGSLSSLIPSQLEGILKNKWTEKPLAAPQHCFTCACAYRKLCQGITAPGGLLSWVVFSKQQRLFMNSRPRSLLRVGTALESLHVLYLGSLLWGLPFHTLWQVLWEYQGQPRCLDRLRRYSFNSGKQCVMNAKQEVQA